ncbi:hypothetical protein [Brevibacillus laterosporus]|uniref:hypothetical protein n=1 Tax=Brevibacillus laterosporus TaxID=1465 RepID=UPI003D1B0404
MNDDLIFSALAYMGNASYQMAWANTCVEDIKEVPEELKNEMKQVNQTIHSLQERLREIRKQGGSL